MFAKIVKIAETYLPDTAANSAKLLLSKLCTCLTGHHFRQKDEESAVISNARNISEREIAGLQYLGGYIVRHVYYTLKRAAGGNKSSLAAILAFKSEEKPTNHKLVSALDRNGLWYITHDFQEILLVAEKTFCFQVKNRENLKLIDQNLICAKIMDTSTVFDCFQNSLDKADVVISDGESKDVLQALLKLFVRVRSFNFAKDVVQKAKLKLIADRNSKKSLRQNLKQAREEFDDI